MKLKSATVLKVIIIICMALVVALAIGAPWIIQWYARQRYLSSDSKIAIVVCYYACTVPAMAALFSMLRILRNIGQLHPFDRSNPVYLGVISWCCLAVSVICAVGGVWYPPLFLVCGTMAFLFLTVRVVLSCFKAAALLQEDKDLTI